MQAPQQIHCPSIAIAGVGYWGRNLLRTFGRLPGTRLTTLCDRAPDPLAATRADHPDLECTTDFDALLTRPDLDAVIVATPPSRHHAMRSP